MNHASPSHDRLDADERLLASMRGVAFSWAGRRRKAASRRVLDGFDLMVRRGEHVGLLGPNGSGKSTALALLAGLQRPAEGEIRWHLGGAALAPTDARARASFAVVFQHPSLDGQLSARENLSLAAQMRGLSRREAEPRIERLLAAVELGDRAGDRVKTFSGGMRRRLDLARALLAEPRTMLLDEPTAGLDEHGFRRFWRGLHDARHAGLTVVTATHRPDEAMLCDRLVLVHEGRVAREGTPASLVAELGEGVLVVTASSPEEVAAAIGARLGLVTHLARPTAASPTPEVLCEVPRGEDAARLLVRVVELFPAGRLDAISLRRPTLADVFARITGHDLGATLEEAA